MYFICATNTDFPSDFNFNCVAISVSIEGDSCLVDFPERVFAEKLDILQVRIIYNYHPGYLYCSHNAVGSQKASLVAWAGVDVREGIAKVGGLII